MDAELAQQTYGQALGALILQKRRAAGLTQTQLAEEAYLSAAKTRRISELESGKVANPHAATIDPIIVALKITDEEVEACAKQASSLPASDLDEAYRAARNLIEAAARQFDHSEPDASLADLDEFLRAKAKEWRELRNQIAEIETGAEAVDSIITRANNALDAGDFGLVDLLLAEAEEYHQQERTLAAIERQAHIRIARGDARLLHEEADAALEAYRAAARFFEPFDQSRMVELLHELAGRVYESSRRSLSPRFSIAVELLDDLAKLEIVKTITLGLQL